MKGMIRMKQIIPFKKELLLKSKINEVTSISLEHTLSLDKDNTIKGNFIISGDYKMTASSINRENFNFTLPVEIDMDDNYDYEKAIVDIDNFYYEIINDDTLKVNIDVFVEAVKKEIEKRNNKTVIIDEKESNEINNKEKDNNEEIKDNRFDINIDSNIDIDVNNISNSKINKDNTNEEKIETEISYKQPNKIDINTIPEDEEVKEDSKVNFFNPDTFSNDTYATYYVYIVKEGDTIDKIIERFKVSKEDIANYNDINDIKKGSKLIIPIINE